MTAHTRTYLTSPHATALIAEADGRPVGYLTGIVDPGLHRRHLLRLHGLSLAARAAGALALRPSLAWLFLSSRLPRYWHKLVPARRRAAAPAGERPVAAEAALDRTSDAPAEREAVLSHIAVTEDARGLGVGAELIERFADFAVLADCTRISLLTAAGAGGAGPYYERLGWRPRGDTRTADDRHFLQYERPLPHFTMP
ncbi:MULTISPECIES: GNAT family N-acetyltransferase [Streptomyces]|uniref:GNAT family N-acetyltransferase n=1 Tax=Streptomyces TaxID=1883 RepID=UPI0033D05E92